MIEEEYIKELQDFIKECNDHLTSNKAKIRLIKEGIKKHLEEQGRPIQALNPTNYLKKLQAAENLQADLDNLNLQRTLLEKIKADREQALILLERINRKEEITQEDVKFLMDIFASAADHELRKAIQDSAIIKPSSETPQSVL